MISDIEVRDAGPKGKGVFALRAFDRNEFIFRRRHSPPITREETAELSEDLREHLCELGGDRFALVLPPGCYLNHSCDPNAIRSGVKVVTWQPIAVGEEITLDYRINALSGQSWPCLCGSPTCTGVVVGSFFAIEPERQHAYLPYAPPFVRREYRRRLKRDAGPYVIRASGEPGLIEIWGNPGDALYDEVEGTPYASQG